MRAQQPTQITLTAPAHVPAYQDFYINGSLTADGNGVGGALLHLQMKYQGEWDTLLNVTTSDDGAFFLFLTLGVTGDLAFRVTYDGDGHYAPSVSNDVIVIIS